MLALYQRVQVNLAVTSNDSRSTRQWRAQRYTEGCRGCWCWWRPTVAAIWCSSAMALGTSINCSADCSGEQRTSWIHSGVYGSIYSFDSPCIYFYVSLSFIMWIKRCDFHGLFKIAICVLGKLSSIELKVSHCSSKVNRGYKRIILRTVLNIRWQDNTPRSLWGGYCQPFQSHSYNDNLYMFCYIFDSN